MYHSIQLFSITDIDTRHKNTKIDYTETYGLHRNVSMQKIEMDTYGFIFLKRTQQHNHD